MKSLRALQEQAYAEWEARLGATDKVLLGLYRGAWAETTNALSSLYAKAGLTTPTAGQFIKREDAIKYGLLDKRLELINTSIDGLRKKAQSLIADESAQAVRDGYYRTQWTLERALGKKVAMAAVKKSAIEVSIYAPESGHTFVDRINKHAADLAYGAKGTVQKSISAGASQSAALRELKVTFDQSLTRMSTLMTSEAWRNFMGGKESASVAASDAGVRMNKQWSHRLGANKDDREAHIELDGTLADENGLFWSNGLSTPEPHMFNDPAEDINCNCVVYDVLEDGQAANPEDVLPPISFADWAEPRGWTPESGWPREALQ